MTLSKILVIPQIKYRWNIVYIFDYLCSGKMNSWGAGRSGTVKVNRYSVIGWWPWPGLTCTITAETRKGFLPLLHTPCQFYGNEASQKKNNLIKRTTKHEFGTYSGRFLANVDGGRVLWGSLPAGTMGAKSKMALKWSAISLWRGWHDVPMTAANATLQET